MDDRECQALPTTSGPVVGAAATSVLPAERRRGHRRIEMSATRATGLTAPTTVA
jgi:hypothetical protein